MEYFPYKENILSLFLALSPYFFFPLPHFFSWEEQLKGVKLDAWRRKTMRERERKKEDLRGEKREDPEQVFT